MTYITKTQLYLSRRVGCSNTMFQNCIIWCFLILLFLLLYEFHADFFFLRITSKKPVRMSIPRWYFAHRSRSCYGNGRESLVGKSCYKAGSDLMKSTKIERGLPEPRVMWMLRSPFTSPASLLHLPFSLLFQANLNKGNCELRKTLNCVICLSTINAAQFIIFFN